MMCNVGKVDRIVRVLSGIVLIGVALYFIPSTIPKTLLLTAAVLLVLSGWVGVCYVYKMLGIATAKARPSPQA
jgi:hypothetical protein